MKNTAGYFLLRNAGLFAYYAVSPFIGAGLSLLIFRQWPSATFLLALVIMAVGTFFASTEE